MLLRREGLTTDDMKPKQRRLYRRRFTTISVSRNMAINQPAISVRHRASRTPVANVLNASIHLEQSAAIHRMQYNTIQQLLFLWRPLQVDRGRMTQFKNCFQILRVWWSKQKRFFTLRLNVKSGLNTSVYFTVIGSFCLYQQIFVCIDWTSLVSLLDAKTHPASDIMTMVPNLSAPVDGHFCHFRWLGYTDNHGKC